MDPLIQRGGVSNRRLPLALLWAAACAIALLSPVRALAADPPPRDDDVSKWSGIIVTQVENDSPDDPSVEGISRHRYDWDSLAIFNFTSSPALGGTTTGDDYTESSPAPGAVCTHERTWNETYAIGGFGAGGDAGLIHFLLGTDNYRLDSAHKDLPLTYTDVYAGDPFWCSNTSFETPTTQSFPFAWDLAQGSYTIGDTTLHGEYDAPVSPVAPEISQHFCWQLTWLPDADHDGIPDADDPAPNSYDGSSCPGGEARSLNVTVSGAGSVSSRRSGIACPTTCSALYQSGSVDLIATAAPDWVFSGWSGDCSATADCSVGMTADRAVTATFTPAPRPPTCQDASLSTQEDVAASISVSCSDLDGDTLTYSVSQQPSHGSLSGQGPTVTYTPSAHYSGPDSFAIRATDPTGRSATSTVSVSVAPVNDAPIATNLTVSTGVDAPVTFALTATDVDSNTLSYTIVSQPSHGTLDGNASALTYWPDVGFKGTDTFTFRASDGSLVSNTATATILVGSDAQASGLKSITGFSQTTFKCGNTKCVTLLTGFKEHTKKLNSASIQVIADQRTESFYGRVTILAAGVTLSNVCLKETWDAKGKDAFAQTNSVAASDNIGGDVPSNETIFGNTVRWSYRVCQSPVTGRFVIRDYLLDFNGISLESGRGNKITKITHTSAFSVTITYRGSSYQFPVSASGSRSSF